MKTCIINFGKNAWYPRGQTRLVQSLREVGYDGDIITYTDEAQLDCPTHQDAPYAFKPHALKRAVDDGYELVIWADCSVWAIKNIQPMFEHIEQTGHMLYKNNLVGAFTSDKALEFFGITRDESFEMEMLMGICMGWDMRTERNQKFLDEWLHSVPSFPGHWTNDGGQVSPETHRVFGHRHDQSAASIIAHRLEMELILAHTTYFQYYENPQKTVYNGDLSMINPSVVMVAQGM